MPYSAGGRLRGRCVRLYETGPSLLEIGFPLGKFQSKPTPARRDGLYIDFAVLDYLAAIRGATMRQIAREAGFPEESLSRARHGRRIREATLLKLVAALKKIPIVEGAELLVADAPRQHTEVVVAKRRPVQPNGSSAPKRKTKKKKEALNAASPARRA